MLSFHLRHDQFFQIQNWRIAVHFTQVN